MGIPLALFSFMVLFVWVLCKISIIVLMVISNFVLLMLISYYWCEIRVNLWLKVGLLMFICYAMNWWRKYEYFMWYVLDWLFFNVKSVTYLYKSNSRFLSDMKLENLRSRSVFMEKMHKIAFYNNDERHLRDGPTVTS